MLLSDGTHAAGTLPHELPLRKWPYLKNYSSHSSERYRFGIQLVLYRRYPRYTVNGNRKQALNTAHLEFPLKSNLVISSQIITNCRIILQVGGGFG